MMRSAKPILIKAAAFLTAIFVCCLPARAQFGMGGGGDMSQWMSSISKRSLDKYAQLVDMTPEQKEAALVLHEGYRSSFKQYRSEIQKATREMMDKARDTGDWMAMGREATKLGKEMTTKMESLEKGFLGDLKALLNDKQAEVWPRVERMRRRENTLRFNFMAGQNVDIFRLLDTIDVKLNASPELSDELERYEIELDKSLKDFEDWGKDQQDKQLKAMEDGDPGKMMANFQTTMKEMGDLCRRMRDTNRRYARTVQSMLPAEKQPRFEQEFNKKSYPRVYRESYPSQVLAAALKFQDLDSAQQDSLTSLRNKYSRDLEGANKTWADAIDAREEKYGGTIGAMMSGMMGGGNDSDDVSKARDARKELDEQTTERLKAILRKDQWARLPEEKPEPVDPTGMDWFMDPPEPDEDD